MGERERPEVPRLYRRRPTIVEARRCREDAVIQTREGPLTARAGDWAVDDVDGNPYPVADDVFRRTYDPIGDDD